MIDIIILTHNHLDDTKQCINSIQTEYPYEIIVVDDGSTDGTVGWCEDHGIKVIPVGGDFIFSRNVNIGVKIGENILKLVCNNDIEFTPDAIDIMVDTMIEEGAGMVGPHSNGVMNLDQKLHCKCKLPNHAIETKRTLNFFCVLIDNAVFEAIGYLDKQFSGYGCDDDDFCIRALQAGYKLVVAPTFVRHNATTTYAETNKHELFNNNIALFKEKWGVGPAQDWVKAGVV